MPAETVYTIKLANQPDIDGDFLAFVYIDGSGAASTVFARSTREEAERAAREWCDWHRSYDPDDAETIQL